MLKLEMYYRTQPLVAFAVNDLLGPTRDCE